MRRLILAAIPMLVPVHGFARQSSAKVENARGDESPITLAFEKAGRVTTTATVRKQGAGTPMGHDAMDGTNTRDMLMQRGPRQ
jgi:hypothetical protein